MYCPNCGKDNQEGTEFCASCGGALNKPKKSLNLKNFDFKAFFAKYKYVVIAVAVVLVVVLFLLLKDSPEKAAKRYMKAIKNCDAAAVVDLIYIDKDMLEDADMTRSEFKKELKKELKSELKGACETKKMKYKILDSDIDDDTATVKVKATLDGETETMELSFTKSGSKWYIDGDDIF